MLVPKIGDTDILDLSSVRKVLVIEKEATFRSIVGSSLWKTLSLSALILTVWSSFLEISFHSTDIFAG